VTATVVLLSLLMAPAAPGAAHAAAPPPCQSFSRQAQTAAMPAYVRAWFAHSTDERVAVCPNVAATGESPPPLYFGEGAVSQQGAVCSYRSQGLKLSGSGAAARLQRYERSEALNMALAGKGCPPPHGAASTPYVETYDITPAAFEEMMQLWSQAAAAVVAPSSQHCCARGAATANPAGMGRGQVSAADLRIAPEARQHLEAALGPDHLLTPTVTRIVRIPGRLLRHRYALFLTVTDPAAESPALYVVYVDKALRSPYEITAFTETN
jgi:hypothetical protein